MRFTVTALAAALAAGLSIAPVAALAAQPAASPAAASPTGAGPAGGALQATGSVATILTLTVNTKTGGRAAVGRRFLFGGRLTDASKTGIAAEPIAVARACPGQGGETLKATTDASGYFDVTDVLTAAVTCQYTVTFAGDATYAPASAQAPFTGFKVNPVLKVTTSATTVNYRGRVSATVHLGATYRSRRVSLYAAPLGTGKRLLATGAVNSAGNLTVRGVQLTRSTDFVALFAGDAADFAVRAKQRVRVRPVVRDTISGYYLVHKAVPPVQYVYHPGSKLTVHVSVTPARPGQCFKLEIQHMRAAAWVTISTSACGHLSRASTGTRSFTVKLIPNDYPEYRIRADYVPGANDHFTTGYGAWVYYSIAPR